MSTVAPPPRQLLLHGHSYVQRQFRDWNPNFADCKRIFTSAVGRPLPISEVTIDATDLLLLAASVPGLIAGVSCVVFA